MAPNLNNELKVFASRITQFQNSFVWNSVLKKEDGILESNLHKSIILPKKNESEDSSEVYKKNSDLISEKNGIKENETEIDNKMENEIEKELKIKFSIFEEEIQCLKFENERLENSANENITQINELKEKIKELLSAQKLYQTKLKYLNL